MSDAWLPVWCLLAAALYASVGHGGASAYLATMTLLSVPTAMMRPTALVLNLCVASIALVQFGRTRAFDARLFAPLALGSIPAAFLAARVPVAPHTFKVLVALAIAAASLRLLWQPREHAVHHRPHDAVLVLTGAAVGVLAGLTGTGGGVFLTPVMVLRRFTDAKTAAGVSAAFILVNSLAGLAAAPQSLAQLPARLPWLIAAVAVGGVVGSTVGVRVFGTPALRRALALVLVVAVLKLVL